MFQEGKLMNKISFKEIKIFDSQSLTIDGVDFRNAILIDIVIDGTPVRNYRYIDLALVVFSELLNTVKRSGKYLIFTSASGIADEGGWEGVEVRLDGDSVIWDFAIEDDIYHFEFEFVQYAEELSRIEKRILFSSNDLEIEPNGVFFPEGWELHGNS